MTKVNAIYENGVLRPTERLPLREGEAVEVTVERTPPVPGKEQEIVEKMKSAKTLQEVFALYESLPPPTDGYDLCKALNENRKATGERLPYPELEEGGP